MTPVSHREAVARDIRLAARAIGRAGIAHAYGHCSRRLDGETFLVGPPAPLALVPAGAACTAVPIHEPLPDGVLGEVRVHQSIYAKRPEVGGIVRSQPAHVMSLSVLGRTPKPRHGFGCYLSPGPAFWDDVQLLRDESSADALASTLGDRSSIVMRGNGAVVVAESLQQAVVLTWYLEDAARVELDVVKSGVDVPPLPDDVARQRATWSGGIAERMWDYLTAGDPELT